MSYAFYNPFISSLRDFEVCGKTGTAENNGPDHSLFVAFAPKDDPKVAIAVIVENGSFGARNALPVARLMMEQYFYGEVLDKYLEQDIKNRVVLRNVALPKK